MTVKSPEPNSKSQSVAWSSLVFVKNIIMNGPFLTLKFQSSLIINHNKSALLSPLPLLFSASSLFIYTRFSFGRMIDAQVWLFSLRLDWKGLIFNGIVCHLKTFSFAKNGTCVHTSWSKRGLKSSLSVLLFAHSYSDRELHSGLKRLEICTKNNVDKCTKIYFLTFDSIWFDFKVMLW